VDLELAMLLAEGAYVQWRTDEWEDRVKQRENQLEIILKAEKPGYIVCERKGPDSSLQVYPRGSPVT
jgi:hypothetical protein